MTKGLLQSAAGVAMQPAAGFVRVSGDRLRLVEADGSPFYFCGANCYYLMVS